MGIIKSWRGYLLALGLLLAPISMSRAATPALPLPEMVIAKTNQPPVIDGEFAPGEWDGAATTTGFVTAFEGNLARAQSVARMTYDDNYIYVAIENYRSANLTFLSKRGRRNDDSNIVFDPANEIWVSPPGAPATTYQTLFNAYPGVFDAKMIPSVGYTAMSWKGNWTIASSETADHWIVEAKAPLKSFGVDHIADNSLWRGLFAADIFGDGDKFRAWAAGGGFADINRHGFWRFKENSPTFGLLDVSSIFTGKLAFPMTVTGPRQGQSNVGVTLRCGAGVAPAADDLVLTKQVRAQNGETQSFTLSGDLTRLNLPLQGAVPTGFCEVTAKDADGTVLYHQVFPFSITGYVRTPPAQIQTTPYTTPFGLDAFYAPLNKQLIVKIDRLYLPEHEQVTSGLARLKDLKTGQVVAQRALAPFYYDYSEFSLDLTKLSVPVQTQADWEAARPAREENQKIAEQNKKLAAGQPPLPLKPVPGVQPAAYTLEVTLNKAGAQPVATTTIPVKLMGYQFEWLPNSVGISDKVIPPWTPLRWNRDTLAMWHKNYQLDALGLARKIENGGQPQLSGPMRLIGTINGQEEEIKAGVPRMQKLTEAGADLEGDTRWHGLHINVHTRAEFDGCVLNTMTLAPESPLRLDRLSLVVTMPAAEAPCFVTTAGGWSAYHGWTPAHWDARETTIGSMTGNFVPYVLLTDSERGFCWFADNEQGWKLDPNAPTQELTRANGTVTLRINFVTKPGLLDKPTRIHYGWMVTPQKPQPAGWRAYNIASSKPYPMAHSVFWNDADWAVLWPYYSSPYPWSYDKSRQALAGAAGNGITGMVGNIAHAIARYRDYQGREFPEAAADWGAQLGDLSNGNVARGRGPNDFQVWHFDKWVKQSGLRGIYFDENYLSEDYNYLTGGAYLLPDESIQPGYSYLGLREYDKRLRYMFHDNGAEPPYLWLHTTSGQAVYAWMPDVSMEGENVEPTNLDNDYLESLPASRLRSIGMGANLGSAPFIMCQALRHWNANSSTLVPQFVGWVLLHDALPEGVPSWPILASEMELWHDDIRFLPYWKTGLGITSLTPDVLISAQARPGETMLWLMNTSRADQTAVAELDFAKLGLDATKTVAFDAETGERYALHGNRLTVPVPARFWRAIRLMQPQQLMSRTTFVARFDKDAVADEAYGNRYPLIGGNQTVPRATVPGKSGQAMPLDQPLTYALRHHVTPEQGSIVGQLKISQVTTNGALLTLDTVKLNLVRGQLTLSTLEAQQAPNGTVAERWQSRATAAGPTPGDWHHFAVSWKGHDLRVELDGKEIMAAQVTVPPVRHGNERILDSMANPNHEMPQSSVTLGPLPGAALDDLMMAD